MYSANKATTLPGGTLKAVNDDISRHFFPIRRQMLLVALVVDPFTLHVYWSIDPHIIAPYPLHAQHNHLTLRLFRLDPFNRMLASQTSELTLKTTDTHRYLQLQQDGLRHVIELGFRNPDKRIFIPLAYTDPVDTPDSHPAPAEAHTASVFIDHRQPEHPQETPAAATHAPRLRVTRETGRRLADLHTPSSRIQSSRID